MIEPDLTASETDAGTRKVPTQLRARATVDAILQAAESIVTHKGYEYATTNYIAKVAGVSIGTVYQYFPKKEAIIRALIESTIINSCAKMREQLLADLHKPLAHAMPLHVALRLKMHRAHSLVLLRLPKNITKLSTAHEQLTPETFLYTTIHAFFNHHREEIMVENLETAILVCEYLVVGAISRYLQDGSQKITEEEFIEQVSAATVRYLTSSSNPRAKPVTRRQKIIAKS